MALSPGYLAGFFDSEGCLYVYESKTKRKKGIVKQMMARVMISNTHLPVLQAIQSEYGGNINKIASKPGALQNLRLDINGHTKILKFLSVVQPHLHVKKEQVDLFMTDYAPTMQGMNGTYRPLTPEQHAKRLEVRDKLRILKRISYYPQKTLAIQ